jgi:hypothetical protein
MPLLIIYTTVSQLQIGDEKQDFSQKIPNVQYVSGLQ